MRITGGEMSPGSIQQDASVISGIILDQFVFDLSHRYCSFRTIYAFFSILQNFFFS
jgi:hypothetical protein